MTSGGAVKVGIIDAGMGNLFSVRNACRLVDLPFALITHPADVESMDALILPGVGAFGEAMGALRRLDLPEAIRDFAASGKPLMGVCLGLHLLFESSEELGDHQGLGLLEGRVTRFPGEVAGQRLRVPHIGWNRVRRPDPETSWVGSPLHDCPDGEFMYFVHSYFVVPTLKEDILSVTDYEGLSFASSVRHQNVFAAQFHPEKSGLAGVHIYREFHDQIQKAARHG